MKTRSLPSLTQFGFFFAFALLFATPVKAEGFKFLHLVSVGSVKVNGVGPARLTVIGLDRHGDSYELSFFGSLPSELTDRCQALAQTALANPNVSFALVTPTAGLKSISKGYSGGYQYLSEISAITNCTINKTR